LVMGNYFFDKKKQKPASKQDWDEIFEMD